MPKFFSYLIITITLSKKIITITFCSSDSLFPIKQVGFYGIYYPSLLIFKFLPRLTKNRIPYKFIYCVCIQFMVKFQETKPLNSKKSGDFREEESTYGSESFAPSQQSPAKRASESECCLRLCSGSISDYNRKGRAGGKENKRSLNTWLIFSCSKRGIRGIPDPGENQ